MKVAQIIQISAMVELRIKHWPDEAVVYSHSSGELNLLDAQAANLLQLITEKPRSLAELEESVATETGADTADADVKAELEEYVCYVVDQLFSLGLVEKAA